MQLPFVKNGTGHIACNQLRMGLCVDALMKSAKDS